MARVIVMHNVDGVGEIHDVSEFGSICGRFWGFCPKDSALRVAYGYNTERTDLDDIFRDNNWVDGTEENLKFGTRSLSVGDVVVIMNHPSLEAHAVESMGWREVPMEEVLEAAGRPARERSEA